MLCVDTTVVTVPKLLVPVAIMTGLKGYHAPGWDCTEPPENAIDVDKYRELAEHPSVLASPPG